MSPEIAINVQSLSKSFSNEKMIFSNLSFETIKNQCTVIMGPSGCGKSTLLKIIAGIDTATGGQIFRHEEKTSSFVFQEACLLPWLSVKDNILVPLKLKTSNRNPTASEWNAVIDALKLQELLSHYPSQLSGGQKMRVSLARALITYPDFLYLDEPFSSLDEPTRESLQEFIIRWQKHHPLTILLVTHSIDEAAFLGNRVLMLPKNSSQELMMISLNPNSIIERDLNYRLKDEYHKHQLLLRQEFYRRYPNVSSESNSDKEHNL